MNPATTLSRWTARTLPWSLALWIGFCAGCGAKRSSSESAGPPAAEASKGIESAFQGAKPEVRAAADQIASALQNQEAPKAFVQLHQLSARTDLTAEQSAAATRALASVQVQLQAAAARGDKAATELLEAYHNSK